MSEPVLKAPFPWFGGKSTVASLVWERLGKPKNYVEPFFGSGAMLLARPDWSPDQNWIETVNDKDGFISNFWRAIQADPAAVERHADWPVNENDLHARHSWLVGQKQSLAPRLEGDPDYYDAKIAGWWVWGICIWIGGGWCSGEGPWSVKNGILGKHAEASGITRQLPHLGNAGMGINRMDKSLFGELSARLRRVRVASGDWSRVCGPSVTEKHGLTGIFLDPPYAVADRDNVYLEESFDVAHEVRDWCLANGENPLLRICLSGYDEHADLLKNGWSGVNWKAAGGFANQGENTRGQANSRREMLYFSPHCLGPAQPELF